MVEPLKPILYDRRLTKDMRSALMPSRPMHELVALTDDPRWNAKAVDLHFRADSKRPGYATATLYVGISKVLDVEGRREGEAFQVKLKRQMGPSFKLGPEPLDPTFGHWQSLADIESDWAAVSTYLHAALTAVPPSATHEGAIQAKLAHGGSKFALVDREVMASFRDEPTAREQLAFAAAPIAKAVAGLHAAGETWVKPPNTSQGKLDALAVDEEGRVLVIEVKPAVASLAGTTPAQVALYLRLLEAWVEQDESHAAAVIEGMLEQRVAVGLLDVAPELRRPVELLPVVALGGEISDRGRKILNQRMKLLADALAGQDVPMSDLIIWWSRNDAQAWRTATVGKL
jgi:hypothetical protein